MELKKLIYDKKTQEVRLEDRLYRNKRSEIVLTESCGAVDFEIAKVFFINIKCWTIKNMSDPTCLFSVISDSLNTLLNKGIIYLK